MATNSYIKGRRYEQKISKMLSKRFGVKFHRVPNSGGLATSTEVKLSQFKGDIFTDDKSWNTKYNAVIECKKIKDPIDLVHYAKFCNGDNVMLSKWILQCIKEAGKKKNFWLIFSWNRGADLIIQGTYAHQWLFTPPIEFKKFLARIEP